jgi:hypothetical protein
VTTHYNSSSRGPVEIASMRYEHALNARDKLTRERADESRDVHRGDFRGDAEMSVATAPAKAGHNNPPKDDPFEAFTAHIGDLFEEAKNFLDGEAIGSDAQADAVSKLLEMLRTAAKDADKARAAEKKPHDDAAKVVQTKWKPLLDKADLAVTTCKRVLAPWLQAKEAAARAAAEVARAAAEAKAHAAAQAMRQTTLDDLAGREQAEAHYVAMGEAVLILTNPHTRAVARQWIDRAPDFTRLTFKDSKRTLPQNDKMWAMLTDIARQKTWPLEGGAKRSTKVWKDLFSAATLAADGGLEVVPGLEGGIMLVGLRPRK